MSAWQTAALGDIFEIARGGSPRPIDAFTTDDPHGINWVMIGDATEGSKYITATKKRIRPEGASRSRRVKPGDFLLTNSMSFGKPYIMRTDGCIHDGWLALSPRNGNVDADFFYYLLGSKTMYTEFARRASGATIKNLNIDLVRGVTVPVPPIAEQRRIAAILDAADALRTKRRAAIAKLDELTQSIFLDMFGDPATNPKGWSQKAFGDVCEHKLGKMLDQKQQTGRYARPYLRNANVQWFKFDLDDILHMDFDERAREALRLKPGDLLICEGGEPGRAAVWRGQIEECYFQKALHRARPNKRLAAPGYLAWLLWFYARRHLLRGVTSATIAHLTGEKLETLPILLPPVALQVEFARRLQKVEDLRRSFEASDVVLTRKRPVISSVFGVPAVL